MSSSRWCRFIVRSEAAGSNKARPTVRFPSVAGCRAPAASMLVGSSFTAMLPASCDTASNSYGFTLNCSDVSTTPVGALAGGEAESAEISRDTATPDVMPASANP